MAKRGRPPTSKTIADLDEGLRREIDQAVDSQANESTRSIYNRFGLAQRGLNFETFRKYVSTRRLARVRTDAEPVTLDKVPDWDELDQWARRYAMERLHAGDAKVYELLLVSRSKREADKAKIEERIDARAEELHKIKIDQLSKDLRKDVETKSEGGTKTLTREDVYDLIDQAMRGSL